MGIDEIKYTPGMSMQDILEQSRQAVIRDNLYRQEIYAQIKEDQQAGRSLTAKKLGELAGKYDHGALEQTLKEAGYNIGTGDLKRAQLINQYGSLESAIASNASQEVINAFKQEDVTKASDFVATLNPSQRQLLADQGIRGLQTKIDEASQAVDAVEGAKTDQGYDLNKLVEANIDSSQMDLLFGEGTYKDVSEGIHAREEIEKYDDPIQAAIEGKIDRKTWEQAGITLEGSQGSPSESFTLIQKVKPLFEKYDGDMALAIHNDMNVDDLKAVYGHREVRSAQVFEENHALDPVSGKWYDLTWYMEKDENGVSTDQVVAGISGMSTEKARAEIRDIFSEKGAQGVDQYIQGLIDANQKTLEPYKQTQDHIGPLPAGVKAEDIPASYDINKLTEDLLRNKAGDILSQKAVISEITRLGFDEKTASDAVKYVQASPEGKFEIMKTTGTIPKDAMYAGSDDQGNPQYFEPDATYRSAESEYWDPKRYGKKDISKDFRDIALANALTQANKDRDTKLEAELKQYVTLDHGGKVILGSNDKYDRNSFKNMSIQAQTAIISEDQKRVASQTGELSMFKYMIPIYGSYLTVKERGWGSGWSIASIVGDAAIIVPIIRGTSIAIKGGTSAPRAVVRQIAIAAEGEIVGPFELVAHPIQSIKSITAPFASFVPKSKTIPLASLWRGSYSKMSLSKVPAGSSPSAIRKAMEEAETAMISGKKSGQIEIDGGGVLHYSSAGIQKELPGVVVSATPYGMSFKNTGLVAQGQGIWTAPSGYLGLEKASATGKKVYYGFKGNDFLGVIDDNKRLLNDHNRVIGQINGDLKSGAKIIGNNGQVIGKIKQQPTFVMIHTNGMVTLPDWADNISDMSKLESIAWKEFSSGKYSGDLYPVFKQYRQWIEQEGLLPKGTRLIPVFDKNGNPVILKTRGASGEVIEVPMMQVVDKNWLNIAKQTTAEMKPILDQLEPKMSVKQMLTKVVDLPSKEIFSTKGIRVTSTRAREKLAESLVKWFKDNPDARLVGSTVEYLHTGKHVPFDIDMGAPNPWKAADELAGTVKRETGIDIDVIKNKDGSARLEWTTKDGVRTEMGNIKKSDDSFDTKVVDGVRMETMESQLERTLMRMEAEFSGKGYIRFRRILSSVGKDVDLGIGAKPPTWIQIEKMRVRGWKNTITDMFNKDLKLDKRLEAARSVDDNLETEVRQLAAGEKHVDDLAGEKKDAESLLNQVRSKKTDPDGRLSLDSSTRQKLDAIRREFDLDDTITKRTGALTALNRKIEAISLEIGRSKQAVTRQESKIRAEMAQQNDLEHDLVRSLSRVYNEIGQRAKTLSKTKRAPMAPDLPEHMRMTDTETASARELKTAIVERPTVMPARSSTPTTIKRVTLDLIPKEPSRTGTPRGSSARVPQTTSQKSAPSKDTAEILSVTGTPGKPGEILWRQGQLGGDPVWIEAKPPSPDDIKKGKRGQVEILRKAPADAPSKLGSPQDTLFSRGKAPEKMEIRVGTFNADVRKGKKITFTKTSPTYMTRSGRGILVGREKPVMRRRKK